MNKDGIALYVSPEIAKYLIDAIVWLLALLIMLNL